MADGKLVFPIRFDLSKGVDDALRDWSAQEKRISDAVTRNAFNIRIGMDASGTDALSRMESSVGALLKSIEQAIGSLNESIGSLVASLAGLSGHVDEVTGAQSRMAQAADDSATRQTQAQGRVTDALRDTAEQQAKVAELIDQYHGKYEEQVEVLARLESRIKANKRQMDEVQKAYKEGGMTLAQYTERNNELLMNARMLAQEKRALTQIMTAEEKMIMQQEGSYAQLSQQLTLLKTALKGLSDEGRGSAFGQELEAAIQSLDAQLKEMSATMGEHQRNVGNYSLALHDGVAATDSLLQAIAQEAVTLQDVADQTRLLEEAKRSLDTSDANYTSTLEALNAKLEENRRRLADVSDILGKEATSVAEAEAQNKRLAEAMKHIDLTSADAKKKLEELRKQIERNEQTIAKATGQNEKFADGLLKLVGVNANIGRSFEDLSRGGNFLDGLGTKMKAFGKTLKGLLSNPRVLTFLGIAGVGAAFKWWYDYNKGLIEASRLTKNFTGLAGEAADKATSDFQALADHMGKGYRETIGAANVLVQQFGLSWKEAMRKMQDGIVAGADMGGNMIANIERFAPALRDMGVSADQLMAILAETRNGIFDEKGIQNMIKGGTRLRAMTKQIAASLDAVGISSEQMQKALNDGSMTMLEAVQQVAAKLRELPENSQEAGNIMKNVFGRVSAEGGALLIQSIADVNTELEKAKESMGELGAVNEAQLNAQKDLNEALAAVFKMSGDSFEIMTAQAKTFLLQALAKMIRGCGSVANWFIRIYNNSMLVRGALNSIGAGFQNVYEVAKFALKQIYDAFSAAGTLIEGIFTLDWDKAKQGFSDGMNALGDNIVNLAKGIASNTANAFNNTFSNEMVKELPLYLDEDGLEVAQGPKKNEPKEFTPIDTESAKKAAEAAKAYLATLGKMEQSLTAINSKFADLAKKEGGVKALEDVTRIYRTQMEYLNSIGRQFGLSFEIPDTAAKMKEYREKILSVVRKLRDSGIKGASDKALELEMKIGLGEVDDLGKELERKLSDMSERVGRSKAVREFYDKVFKQTGSVTLATDITASIYGDTGGNLQKQVADLVRKYFSGVEVELPIDVKTGEVDFSRLRKIWESDKALPDELRRIPAAYDSAIKQMIENGEAFGRKQAEQWLEDLQQARTYADKRVELARYTAERIGEIEAKRDSLNPESEDYDRLRQMYEEQIAGYRRRESKQMEALDFEAFKEMPFYTQIFADLDRASSTALNNMRSKLEQMRGAWKDLDPSEIREIQERLDEVDMQLARRNPFKALADSLREYRELRKQGTKSDADKALVAAADEYAKAKADLERLLKENPNDEAAVNEAKALVDSTEKAARKAQELADRWAKVEKVIGLSGSQVMDILGSLGSVAGGIAKVTETLGGSEEDVQYWNDIASGLDEVAGSVGNVLQAALSGDVVGIVTSALTAIPNLISGFSSLFSANKVRKANKEIKRQQEQLERLERTYNRLNAASDKLFGSDYISNFNNQVRNLEAQKAAYEKQAQAERSKGKKEDKEKTKEYLDNARQTAEEIEALKADLTAHFTGSDKQSAAREFASAWLDARMSFADTADAIKSKYKDMMRSMLVEGAFARVMENALTPLWDQMDKAFADNDPTKAIEIFANGFDSFLASADNGMEVLFKAMEARGIDLKNLMGDADSKEYTGIKREYATASEESINGLTAATNTQNFYIAQIYGSVSGIERMMAAYNVTPSVEVNTGSDRYTPYQTDHLAKIDTLTRHTAEILAECRRSANECENMTAMMRRVISSKGAKQVLNVSMN